MGYPRGYPGGGNYIVSQDHPEFIPQDVFTDQVLQRFINLGYLFGACAGWQAKQHNEEGIECSKLLDLLVNSRHFEATDPRDKVYDVLGLAADAENFP
jgi:hypothetical protein